MEELKNGKKIKNKYENERKKRKREEETNNVSTNDNYKTLSKPIRFEYN